MAKTVHSKITGIPEHVQMCRRALMELEPCGTSANTPEAETKSRLGEKSRNAALQVK